MKIIEIKCSSYYFSDKQH